MQVTILSPSAGISGGVFSDIPAHGDDFPVPSWPRTTGQRPKGSRVVFVAVRSANAAGFHLDQHFIVSDGGNGIFTDFKCLWCCQDSGACGLLHDVLTLSLAARILQEQIVMKGTPPVENGSEFPSRSFLQYTLAPDVHDSRKHGESGPPAVRFS